MTDVGGAFSRRYRTTTIGVFALGFLIAFEALAVTTAMPLVARDLGGGALYALAFSAFTSAGVVGTVIAGAWSDRSGPAPSLLVAAGLFALGLLLAGAAWSMPVLVAARVVQGFGAGAAGSGLYVLVARVYPERLHPRIFALLAAAWVLPALVGPFAAGAVATYLSWHWVFLGILPLVAAAVALLLPALRGSATGGGSGARIPRRRIGWAVLAASAVLVMQPALAVPGAGPLIALVAAAVAVLALRPLLPAGALVGSRGVPALVAARALLGAGFACADAYLPYSLIDLRGIPAPVAGGIVTVGAVSWALGSEAQSRLANRVSDRGCVAAGALLFLVGLTGVGTVELAGAPIPLLIAAWLLTGLGVGLAYPRISTSTLAQTPPETRGASSAALQVGEGFGDGLALTTIGVVSALVTGASFAAAFGLAVLLALLAALVAPRTAPPRTAPTGRASRGAGGLVR